ncbi:bacterial DNA-binding family protein [Candidatus Phytoplasma oryzae]|uniref:Bacterial DNA-binding family protein n=2 Tax=Candidatus Phytoplasma oryzae TaxID=203274 RepID=A0A139JQT0_9MOLU|nr:bacterial DNA-binding family protein [Candidatus Phytoplasma oryzae]RAM57709.1 hypothetical protein DH96_02075 [Candidatus Phytoplasma oryzae]
MAKKKKIKQQTSEKAKITQKELITKIAKKTRHSQKEIHHILFTWKEVLYSTLSQGKGVSFSPIGSFKIKKVPTRKGLDMNLLRTAKKKRMINFPAHQTVTFSLADDFKKAIKTALNKK